MRQMMGRSHFSKNSNSRNTQKKRSEKKKVLIALEDTKSSKYYFEKLIQDKGLSGEVVFAKHIGTDPGSVVDAVVQHSGSKENKKTTYEKKWVVIDKDDYSAAQINGAIQRARDLDICVAISNEAYELWILLHFVPITAHTNRVDLNRKLARIFDEEFKISYSKASQDIYQLIIGWQEGAITNSKNLVKAYNRDNGRVNPFSDNPLTTVYQLVEYLNSLSSSADPEEEIGDCFPKADLDAALEGAQV